MFNPMSLEGRRILITGASSGIGRETAVLTSKLGASVVLVGRSEERLIQTLYMLENGQHSYFVIDLSIVEGIEEMFKKVVNGANERLDGLVHSAGVINLIPLRNLTPKYIEATMKINFYSFIELVRLFSLKKYSLGGSIVGVSSVASSRGEMCQTAYSASKAALDAAVRTLSYELVKKNIRINSVRPGTVYTEASKKSELQFGAELLDALKQKQLLGLGRPVDVSYMIAFLLSNASNFITGRSLDVDGGFM
jgi:NAD(P)-dependent dehydrogenase (short-subunit alcohol dehydrogenase family)